MEVAEACLKRPPQCQLQALHQRAAAAEEEEAVEVAEACLKRPPQCQPRALHQRAAAAAAEEATVRCSGKSKAQSRPQSLATSAQSTSRTTGSCRYCDTTSRRRTRHVKCTRSRRPRAAADGERCRLKEESCRRQRAHPWSSRGRHLSHKASRRRRHSSSYRRRRSSSYHQRRTSPHHQSRPLPSCLPCRLPSHQTGHCPPCRPCQRPCQRPSQRLCQRQCQHLCPHRHHRQPAARCERTSPGSPTKWRKQSPGRRRSGPAAPHTRAIGTSA